MSERYAFIAAEKADKNNPHPPVVKMCAWLEVSTSGFYAWACAEPSARERRRTKLAGVIEAVYAAGRGAYGVRRVHAALASHPDPEVAAASLNLVRALMSDLGLAGRQPRAYKRTTTPDPDAQPPADHVRRDFTAQAPGSKLVGDITYLRTMTGWVYLATVIDCYSRMVIGWSMATHMRTDLVCDAITMATGRGNLQPHAIFHSDRGAQYTSTQFAEHLETHHLTASVGRRGQCWDNALAESFFGALKTELVYQTTFRNAEHARQAVAEYIEVFYNRTRLHSSLGYKTPEQVATSYNQNRDNAA